MAVERMLAGVATRSFTRAGDPIGTKARQQASATWKSSVSRRFVTGTKKALDELLGRDLSELDVAVLMIDGVDFAAQTCVVALVVTADGPKLPSGCDWATPRTAPSSPPCWPTSSNGAWTQVAACWS